MPKVKAPVNNEILIWAREVLGYELDFVAKKLSQKKEDVEKWIEKIKAWESGEDQPTFTQLDELSELYFQPAIVFYYEKPPEQFPLPADFRRISDESESRLEPETKIAIWEAQWRQSVAESIREEMGIEIAFKSIGESPTGDAEVLARTIRNEMGITYNIQKNWSEDLNNLFKRWREVLEDIGILVFKFSFPRKNARAFALPGELAPVITVNSKDFLNAKIFSLFHEFCHLLFSQSSTCNDFEFRGNPKTHQEKTEVFCNHFAGAFLIPAEMLMEHPKIKQVTNGNDINESVTKEIARNFGVSHEVVLRRLSIIGSIDNIMYRNWREQRTEYWDFREPSSGGGGGDEYAYIRKVISQQGQAYTDTILSAYSEKIISLSEASEYLNVQIKHIKQTQEFLYSGGTKL